MGSLLYFNRNYFLLFILFVCGCANIVSPTGGDRDVSPPKIISTTPPNLTIFFNKKEAHFLLNEYFSMNNPATEIYLSPLTSQQVRWKTRKKKLIITIPDSLKENTTYTLHLGNSIVDNTEANKIEGYKYVFSTGPVIDSFRIQGVLYDEKSKKPQKDFLVMLYSAQYDSIVTKNKPDYFTRTDEKGKFVLGHLFKGNYRLFSLADKNQNYLYDQPTDEIAFLDSIIFINDTTEIYTLNTFLPISDHANLLNTSTIDNKKISFNFNQDVKNISIQTISDSTQILFESNNRTRDTFFIWVNTAEKDSVFFQMRLNNKIDTVGVKLRRASAAPLKNVGNKMLIKTNLNGTKNNYKLFSKQKLAIYFLTPLKSMAKDLFPEIIIDSIAETQKTEFIKKIDSLTRQPYVITNYEFEYSLNYTVVIPAGLFEDIYGNKNDSIVFKFNSLEETATGNLILAVNRTDSLNHYIAQLLFNNSIIMERGLDNGKNIFEFNPLIPGLYKLQFIRDENNNGKWDTGDYWKGKQPEKIILYKTDITIRPNWDSEIITEVGLPSKSKMKE